MPDPYSYLETICTQKPSKAEAGMTLMILAIRPFAESSESRHAPQWRRMMQEQSSPVPLRDSQTEAATFWVAVKTLNLVQYHDMGISYIREFPSYSNPKPESLNHSTLLCTLSIVA